MIYQIFKLAFTTFLIFTSFFVSAQNKAASPHERELIFPKGERAPSENFTGAVWVHRLIEADSVFNIPVATVTFERGPELNGIRTAAVRAWSLSMELATIRKEANPFKY